MNQIGRKNSVTNKYFSFCILYAFYVFLYLSITRKRINIYGLIIKHE